MLVNCSSQKYNSVKNRRNSSLSLHQPFCHLFYVLFIKNTTKFFQSKQKWLVQRERSFCSFWWNHVCLSCSSLTFRIILTRDSKHLMGCAGFSSFLADIKVFWKYWALDTTKETWIIPHEAVENSGRTFLGGFDALKGAPPSTTSKREHVYLKSPVYHEGMLEWKKIL